MKQTENTSYQEEFDDDADDYNDDEFLEEDTNYIFLENKKMRGFKFNNNLFICDYMYLPQNQDIIYLDNSYAAQIRDSYIIIYTKDIEDLELLDSQGYDNKTLVEIVKFMEEERMKEELGEFEDDPTVDYLTNEELEEFQKNPEF